MKKIILLLVLWPNLLNVTIINGQHTEITFRKKNSLKTFKLESYKHIKLYTKNEVFEADIHKFSEDYMFLRRSDRSLQKFQYDTITSISELEIRKSQNWKLNKDLRKSVHERPSMLIARSFDIDSISYSDINLIEFRKKEPKKLNGLTGGFLIFPLAALTSPLWARDDKGKYDWRTGATLLMVSSYFALVITIDLNRTKLRTYKFGEWNRVLKGYTIIESN